MSKKTPYILGILFTIIVGTILYYFLCCSVCCGKESCKNKTVETKQVVKPEIKETTRKAFEIIDYNGDFILKLNDNFNFKTSSFSILNPIAKNIINGITTLKDYLLVNPLKTITIIGLYKSDEVNHTAFPNLGLARANSVKNYFISSGISSKQIDITGELNDELNPDINKTLFGPLSFDILTNDSSETSAIDALKITCDAIRENPLILHFNVGQSAMNLSAEQRQKFADISNCIDKLGVKVKLIGHTDNSGNPDKNIELGQQRANFAKAYLIKNGILEVNVESYSKGELEPVTDNTTEAGKAQNRRTVVTIN